MTADYAPDAAILARVVADGLWLGAASFAADIEAVASDGHARVRHVGATGFRVP